MPIRYVPDYDGKALGTTFNNMLRMGQNPLNPGAGTPDLFSYKAPTFDYSRLDALDPSFQQGQDLLKTDYLNSPETKALLANADSEGKFAYDNATSTAQALASRRGLAGSSTEQFGVGQAGLNSNRATIDARNQILLQAMQRQQAARDLAANALFNRAGATQAGEYGLANTGAQLSSDELTSLRNAYLGNQATNLGYANINQANAANRRSNNPLNLLLGGVSSGATAAIAPF